MGKTEAQRDLRSWRRRGVGLKLEARSPETRLRQRAAARRTRSVARVARREDRRAIVQPGDPLGGRLCQGTIVIRPAALRDLSALASLAKRLDTANLPSDAGALRDMVRRSVRSFAGKVRARADAVYVFVAEDRPAGKIAGVSVIVAKHGTPDSPHYYLEMVEEERYSKSLRRLFRHTYLHMRRSFDGPTEVGGLIVDPAYHGHEEKIGTQLSYVRFLYMGMYRERFEPTVLAEMLPTLTPAGKSPLWECYGRRVTGLSFQDADLLCRRDKEFIDALFPESRIYVCMLPERVRNQLGVVGPRAAAALHLLEKIGFRFLGQIDPFDGGPYYGARLEDVTLVRQLRHYRVQVIPEEAVRRRRATGRVPRSGQVLVGAGRTAGLRAIRVRARIAGGQIHLGRADAARLGVRGGSRVAAVALP